jgi:uncharacterized protein YcbK (DUF882 family)
VFQNNGVAQKSLHMKEQTLVVRTAELKTKDLHDIAINLRKGGLG